MTARRSCPACGRTFTRGFQVTMIASEGTAQRRIVCGRCRESALVIVAETRSTDRAVRCEEKGCNRAARFCGSCVSKMIARNRVAARVVGASPDEWKGAPADVE